MFLKNPGSLHISSLCVILDKEGTVAGILKDEPVGWLDPSSVFPKLLC